MTDKYSIPARRRPAQLVIAIMAMMIVAVVSCGRGAEHFVDANAIDFKKIIGPPPADDSPQTRQEIDQMLALQAKRTPEEIERIKSEVILSPWVFSNVLGSSFNPDDLPLTTKLLQKVARDTSTISGEAKGFYNRKRPPLVDDRIKPCIELETSPSYPSGHSTRATVFAAVLAELYPDKRDALIARGKQIGDDRVIAGEHFPSDIAAGRVLGDALVKQMMADPDFQKELADAKAECQAVAKNQKTPATAR